MIKNGSRQGYNLDPPSEQIERLTKSCLSQGFPTKTSQTHSVQRGVVRNMEYRKKKINDSIGPITNFGHSTFKEERKSKAKHTEEGSKPSNRSIDTEPGL